MSRLRHDKFWICPICRSEISGGALKCFQCQFTPAHAEDLLVKKSSLIPGFVVRRIALQKALNASWQTAPGTDTSKKGPDKYRPVTFHRNPEAWLKQPGVLEGMEAIQKITPSPQDHSQSSKRARPAPAQILDPYLFELYCAEWCSYFGHKDVSVTRNTKDGGVDVEGDTFIAQVKFQELPVGVRPIRELAGVLGQHKEFFAYFFTLNGFSNAALREGEELGLALFEVKPFTSTIVAKSPLAELVLEDLENSPKESSK